MYKSSFNADPYSVYHVVLRACELYSIVFGQVSGLRNFTSEKYKLYFNQQIDDMHVGEREEVAPVLETEIHEVAWRPYVLSVAALAAILKGMFLWLRQHLQGTADQC